MRRACKGWWTTTRNLLQHKGKISSILALKDPAQGCILDAAGKAELFAKTFADQCHLCDGEDNYFSEIHGHGYREQKLLAQVTDEAAVKMLCGLKEDSGSGPDLLPSRLLKLCAKELAEPVRRLTNRILECGRWPSIWILHWIVPLFKKKNVFDAKNYRGIHLTAQLSKVVERIFKELYVPYLSSTVSFGPNQFAYTKGRGARDAVAQLVLTWIAALARGNKIGVYCSDVSGAFDRVNAVRLIAKLRSKKLRPEVVDVILRPGYGHGLHAWLLEARSQRTSC
jgi:hypothetical protein